MYFLSKRNQQVISNHNITRTYTTNTGYMSFLQGNCNHPLTEQINSPEVRPITERVYCTEVLGGVHPVPRVVTVLVDLCVITAWGDHHRVPGAPLGLVQGLVHLMTLLNEFCKRVICGSFDLHFGPWALFKVITNP